MGWIFSLVMLALLIFKGGEVTPGEVLIAAGLFAIAGSISFSKDSKKSEKAEDEKK